MNSLVSGQAKISWAARADVEDVADHIAAVIGQKGSHQLAVPGGRTPLPIFETLSRRTLPWGTVSLMLTDDRIVPDRHPASNHGKLSAAFATWRAFSQNSPVFGIGRVIQSGTVSKMSNDVRAAYNGSHKPGVITQLRNQFLPE